MLPALVTSLLTPWIARRSLVSVTRLAAEVGQIDMTRRGIRLTRMKVPSELGPLVRAVSETLARLDEGYERQRRFQRVGRARIAPTDHDDSHEDRGVAAMPPQELQADVARLANNAAAGALSLAARDSECSTPP